MMHSLQKNIILLISSLIVLTSTGCTTQKTKDIRSKTISLEKKINAEKKHLTSDKSISSFYIPHEEVTIAEKGKSERVLRLEAKKFTLRGYFDEINNLSSKIASMTNIPIIVEQGITNRTELAGKESTLSGPTRACT